MTCNFVCVMDKKRGHVFPPNFTNRAQMVLAHIDLLTCLTFVTFDLAINYSNHFKQHKNCPHKYDYMQNCLIKILASGNLLHGQMTCTQAK